MNNRKSTRLKGFDYGGEASYFITINTANRLESLGKIQDGKVILSQWGKIAKDEWLKTAEIRNNVTLDSWVIMPNHLHGIIIIGTPVIPFNREATQMQAANSEASKFASPSGTVGAIVRGFKAACTTKIRIEGNSEFGWQRNYHDRIIRNQQELSNIQNYINNNPTNWKDDNYNWEAEEVDQYHL
ncbi:MAG: hypothetical protein JKX73_06425 [Flavobacteriales bacterium]|nr:hypothetical protein [Flavobacteriales bacterium]